MVIFHSHVKLPEGNQSKSIKLTQLTKMFKINRQDHQDDQYDQWFGVRFNLLQLALKYKGFRSR